MAGAGGGHESSGQPPPGPVIYSVHSAAHIPQEIARGIGVPLQYLGFNHPMLHTNDGVQQSFPSHNPRRPDPRSQNTQTRPTVTSPPVSRVIMPAWQHNKPMPLAGIHPYQWTKADVLTWVRWAVDEFSLTGVDEQRFGMNGKALCLLGKEGFTDRVPFAGDVLYNLLHNLIQGYEHLARNNIPISHHHATPVCYPTPPSTTPSPQITVSSPGATGMTRLPDSGDPVPTQPVVSQKSETDKPEVDNPVTSSCSQTGSTEIVRTASAQLHKLKEQHEKLLPSVLSAPELQVQEDPVATSLSPTMPELTKIEDCPTSVITTASQTITTESSQETVIQRPMVAPVAPNSARCEEDQNKPTSQEPTPIQGHKRDPLSRHPKRRWSVDAVARETANPISQDQRAAKVNRVGPTMEGVLQVQGRMMSPPSLPGEKPQRVGENIFIPCPEIERELAKLRERDARRMKLYDKSINEESLRAQRRYMAYAEPGRIIRPFDQVQFQAHLQGGSAVRPPSHAGPVVGEAAVLQHPHGAPHLTQVHAMSAQQVVTPANTPVSVAQKPVALSSTNGAQQQESTTDHQGKERADAQSTQTQETANVDGLKSQKTPDKASEPSHSQPRDGNMPPAVPPGHTALGPHLIRGDARLPFLHSTIEQLRARPPPFLPYMRFPFPAQILGPDGKPLQEMVARHRLPVPVFPQYTRQERDRGPEQVPTSGERQVYLPPTSVEQPPRLVFPPNSTASDQTLRTLPVPPIYRLTVPTAPPSGSSQDQLPVHDPRGRPQDRPVSSRPEDPPSAPPQEHTPVMTDVRVKVEKPEGPEERYGVTPENRQGHDQVTSQQSFPIIKTEPREEEPSEVTGQGQTQSTEAVIATTVEPVVQQAVSVTNKAAQVMIMPMPHPDPRGPPPPPVKRGRGRPRIYWPGYRKKPPPQNNTPPGAPVRGTKCRLLWEFLLRLLANEEKYKHAIKWLDKPRKVFRIVNANAIAKLWGKQKNRENMTYEKLSRAMRYYYRMDILVKEGSQRLTYRFIKGLEDIHADRANRRRNRSGSTNGTTPPNPPPLTNEPHNRMGVLDEDLNGEAKPQSSNVGNMQHETQRLYGTNVENVSSRDSMQVKPEGGSAGHMPTQDVSSPVSPGYGQALDVKMFRRSHLRPQEVENATAVPKMEKDTLQIKIPYRSEDTPVSSEQNVRNFRPSLDPQYIELNRMLHHQAIPSSVASSKGYHRTTDNVPQVTVTTAPPIFKKRRFSVDGATPYPTTSLDVSKNTKDTAERETAGSAVTEPYPHPRHHAVSADAHVHVRITEAPSPKRTKVHHIFFPPSEHPPEDRQTDSERDKDDSGEQEEPLDMSVKKT